MAVRLCLLVTLGACNFVYGLDPTSLRGGSPRTLAFDNSASDSDLIDFPVLVAPDMSFDFTDVDDPTTQVTFADASGAVLPFEVEHWDPAGGSVFWVKVPRIAKRSTDTTVTMAFGADVRGQADPGAVWSDYEIVAHGATQPGLVPDATGRSPVRGTGFTARPGSIGDAIGFPGYGTFDNTSTIFAGWRSFTIEFWIYPDYPSSAIDAEPRFLHRDRAMTLGRVYSRGLPDIVTLQLDAVFATSGGRQMITYVALRRWSHVTMTYDGQQIYVYLNGTFVDIQDMDEPLVSGTALLELGRDLDALKGMLDELRISRASRTSDWVNAQFLSMNRRFVSFL